MPEIDMQLPPGKICADCLYIIKCKYLIGRKGTETECDWAPSRFIQAPFDFHSHLARQREFSERTFGPGKRTAGVIDHIRKELLEIERDPDDILEWIDVVILALDGAWRAGFSPEQIIAALVDKQTRNEARKWPDWRLASPDKAIEHDRAHDPKA